MVKIDLKKSRIAVFGTGVTGLSVARFLSARNLPFVFVDSREKPPALSEIQSMYPETHVYTGPFTTTVLMDIDLIVVSPGISLEEPVLVEACARGIEIIGDLALFCSVASAPVVGITGSNGKSTVTSLVGEMASASGFNVGVGGNLGIPMLDLLAENRQLYILELSSFQLDTAFNNNVAVAALLNISSDHMDRYATMEKYIGAKHRIFSTASIAVVNREDSLTVPTTVKSLVSFGLDEPGESDFGVRSQQSVDYLCKGKKLLIALESIALKGAHNVANVAAAVAIGDSIGLPYSSMLQVLKDFDGLPHRCQTVTTVNDVLFVNDSKGTNVGATSAAITSFGLSRRKNIILIAGGQGKGQDFRPLAQAASEFVKLCIVFGEDADQIGRSLYSLVVVDMVSTLVEAVALATVKAEVGDTVLFSPACASFDQFSGYEERGNTFVQAVLISTGSVINGRRDLC